jgi:hypothetical protein
MPVRSVRSPFTTTARTGFITGVHTTQNQGGGDKKAGLAPSVGKDSWVSVFRKTTDPEHGRCCTRGKLEQTLVFTRNTVRPIDGRSTNYKR